MGRTAWKHMVLEGLINPVTAEKHPWEMVFFGGVYSSLAIIISLLVFRPYASLVTIFLTVMASIPVIYGAIKMEEKKDLQINESGKFIEKHGKILLFFSFLFLGYLLSFTLWFLFLPTDVSQELFQVQLSTISDINTPTGKAIHPSDPFTIIFFNNIKVLVFCLLFALFYGFGAVFILTWNASVIGTAIGVLTQKSGNWSYALPLAFLQYSLHGYLEIIGFFLGGLAGGIISVAVIRHDIGSTRFRSIMTDSTNLVIAAILILAIAAVVEVYINPLIF